MWLDGIKLGNPGCIDKCTVRRKLGREEAKSKECEPLVPRYMPEVPNQSSSIISISRYSFTPQLTYSVVSDYGFREPESRLISLNKGSEDILASVVQWLGFHPSMQYVRWRFVFDSRRLHPKLILSLHIFLFSSVI